MTFHHLVWICYYAKWQSIRETERIYNLLSTVSPNWNNEVSFFLLNGLVIISSQLKVFLVKQLTEFTFLQIKFSIENSVGLGWHICRSRQKCKAHWSCADLTLTEMSALHWFQVYISFSLPVKHSPCACAHYSHKPPRQSPDSFLKQSAWNSWVTQPGPNNTMLSMKHKYIPDIRSTGQLKHFSVF